MSKLNATYEYDVVVLGGGLSGLSAAYKIKSKSAGLSYAVLEANDRVGGRTIGQQLKAANGTDHWDLGGQWVGTCQPHIMRLLDELGLGVYEQYMSGTKVMQLGSEKVSTYKSDIPSLPVHALIDLHLFMGKLEKMAQQVPADDPSQCPKAAEWDSITFKSFLDKALWTKGARDTVEAAGRTIFGQESHQISLLYYLAYASAAGGLEALISAKPDVGGQQYRVSGGAFQVCQLLADKLGRDTIHLQQAAVSVQHGEGDTVTITTNTGRVYKCRKLIVALPPNQIANLRYTPSLPIEKQHVFSRMPMGNLTKLIITYRQAFWRDAGFSGEAVTSGGGATVSGVSRGPLSVVFDATTCNNNPALVSFIGGDQQLEYMTIPEEQRKLAVLKSLCELFGEAALDYLDYAEKNWNDEPYSGGCPVCVGTPGMMTLYAPALRDPVGSLHFAGTESATVWCGFLNGAVQAGYRAAHEVLYHLARESLDNEELEDTAYKPVRKSVSFFSAAQISQEKIRGRPHVLRFTVGLAMVFVALAVGKRVYFRIAL